VALGGEVHQRVDLVLAQQTRDRVLVTNVGLDEDVAAVRFQITQVLEVARVGQRVDVDDQIGGTAAAHQACEARPDEPGTAGD